MATRNVDLFLHLARPPGATLLAGRRDLTIAEPPVFFDGERPLLRLQFLQPSSLPGGAPTVTALAEGDAILFSLKKKAGSTLLVSGAGFLASGAGEELRYEALVNFNTTALAAAFAEETLLAVVAEVRLQNADATERKLFQFGATVRRRLYDGEGDPVAADPEYPAAESLALRVPANGTYRIKTAADGQYFQLQHAATGAWHTLFVTGDPGAEQLAIGPAEA